MTANSQSGGRSSTDVLTSQQKKKSDPTEKQCISSDSPRKAASPRREEHEALVSSHQEGITFRGRNGTSQERHMQREFSLLQHNELLEHLKRRQSSSEEPQQVKSRSDWTAVAFRSIFCSLAGGNIHRNTVHADTSFHDSFLIYKIKNIYNFRRYNCDMQSNSCIYTKCTIIRLFAVGTGWLVT